jgi:excisionase family DNA binding protein
MSSFRIPHEVTIFPGHIAHSSPHSGPVPYLTTLIGNIGNLVCDMICALCMSPAADTVTLACADCKQILLVLDAFKMEDLISVTEAARQLGGISKWTVYSWLTQGRVPRVKVGSRTMLRESDLSKLIEVGGKSPTPAKRHGG